TDQFRAERLSTEWGGIAGSPVRRLALLWRLWRLPKSLCRVTNAHWPQSRQEVAAAVALLEEWADARVRAVAARLGWASAGLVVYQDQLAQQVAPWIAQGGKRRCP